MYVSDQQDNKIIKNVLQHFTQYNVKHIWTVE